MDKAISATEANRTFSSILREVREGRTYVVTSHGRPVARIVPLGNDEKTALAARDALLRRLTTQAPVHAQKWTREELYEDEGDP